MRSRTRLAAVVAALALAALSFAPAALAAAVGTQHVVALAKRAASARVERYGIGYPPSAWKAACDRRTGGGWRCAVGTGGQCSGVVTITGTSNHPRVRHVDVSCIE